MTSGLTRTVNGCKQNMAVRAAAAVSWRVLGGRKCGCVLPYYKCNYNLITPTAQLYHRRLPVCSKVQFSSLPNTRDLQIQDDFFTHLHAQGQEVEGNLSLLLFLFAQRGDHTSIHHLLEKAEAAGVRPSGYTMENILNTHIRRKQLDAAVSLYASINKEYAEASLDSCTVLGLCTMLMEEGKDVEALQILKDYVAVSKRPEVCLKNTTESCKVLLNKAAQMSSYEILKEMLDLVLLAKLVDSGPQVTAPLLQYKLDRDDLIGTVEEAEYIYTTFNTLPKRMEVLIRLMQHNTPTEEGLIQVLSRDNRRDGDLLGRMFDLVQSCYSLTQAQHDLLFACLESGHPNAARLMLQTLAGDLDGRQLVRVCKIYAKNKREAALAHLLTASKGMTNIDRAKIYEILLDAYKLSSKEKVGEEAVSLWKSMQEEGLTPSPTFLSTLTTLLENCDIQVPFQAQ